MKERYRRSIKYESSLIQFHTNTSFRLIDRTDYFFADDYLENENE